MADTKKDSTIFPTAEDAERIALYQHNDLLAEGKHFDVWNIKSDNQMTRYYASLRYIVCNFAGLASKVMADMLFGEPIKVHCNTDANQLFLDALIFNNKLHIQNHESAMNNSARGDALYKVRTGKRYPTDDKDSVIIEEISPLIYFPELDPGNVRAVPLSETLAWVISEGNTAYLRKEIHKGGNIRNEVYEYDSKKKQIISQIDWAVWMQTHPGSAPEQIATKVKRSLIIHVPNFRRGSRYFGVSDYHDLESLFFALNNRITKIDNILDKHSDPILAVPEGVLDENGNVRKEALGMFEIPAEGSSQKPEYIVWNANLEAAFSEIDKMLEMLFMFSEISPDTLGMGKGQSDSGRALKLKLLRTIAKKKRKERYYDQALKEVFLVAQELAKAWGLSEVMDGKTVKAPDSAETPEIEYGDGVVNDTFEQAQEEQIRLDSGNTTVKASIMRLDGVDEKTAEKLAKEIDEEGGLNLPLTKPAPTDQPSPDETMPGDMMPAKNMPPKPAPSKMPMAAGPAAPNQVSKR